MGKGGDLWDDSALVNAFEHAVSTFKAMHGKNTQSTSCENEKTDPPASAEQEESISVEATHETLKQPSEESKTIERAALHETDSGEDIHVSEATNLSSDLIDADRNISSSQQGDHNELLRQYYELEEQSRNVLQQLQQTNYWDSQAPYFASTYQQPPVPAYSDTAQDPNSSTAQSSCCYWNCPVVSLSCYSASQPSGNSASVSPYGGCSVSLTYDHCPGASTKYPAGANFMQPLTKLSTNNDQVTKAAMMTAEGAFNFMRSAISGDADSQRADNDLAVVLNAWFAAGFYTGRYIAQQQQSNKN